VEVGKKMRIAVIAVGRSGEEARTQVDIAPTESVGDLYQRVSQALNKNIGDFNLTYKDQLLKDKSQKIASLGIKEGDTVYATILATGGGLKEAIKRMMGFPSSPIFSDDVVYYRIPLHGTLKSEEEWLNRELVEILIHQPAVKVIDLRHYYFEYRATQGPFTGLIFKLHIFIKSPYEPPGIYCENAYSHPNFYSSGKLCIATSWQDFGSLWEYLERVKIVINEPNYSSPAR
jgi:ubiquitin-protein ligase